jgi:hypothetical protein
VGPLGGKWRQLVGKVREWYAMSWHLQGYIPRLCRFKADGLAPMSKYWTYRSHAGVYELSKPSSQMSTGAWLFPTASRVGSGEKLGTDPQIIQPGWGLCREPFFSGVVDLCKSVDDCAKCCYMWTTWDTYGPGPYEVWAWKACGMLVRFSLAGCTLIRIATALGYE